MLQHTHVPRTLPDDRGDLLHIESTEDAEQDHFGLVGRQPLAHERDGGVGAEHVERCHRGIVIGGLLAKIFGRHCDARSTRFAPSRIDQSVPGDREQPRPELLLVTTEGREVSRGNEPGLGFDVLGNERIESTKESQQTRMEVPPQDRDGARRTAELGREHGPELGRRHVSR